MEATGLGLRNLNISTPFCFPTTRRASLFRPFNLAHFKLSLHFPLSSQRFSTLCSLSEGGKEGSLPRGVGKALSEVSALKILQVVLVSPQIPGNTGCIARTCAASAVGLHLVGPLGFQVDDAKLKRAGLDYWPFVVVKVHRSWEDFQDYFGQQEGEKRLLAFTKRGTKVHSEFSYRRGDYLLFGSETSGLPPETLLDCKTEPFGGGTIRIPMVETYVRCLNLSVSVGIALYEASRQLKYEQLEIPSEDCIHNEQLLTTEDIFA
ncbi:tRNA/rRNA methyltransferase family protein [Quillaja saponaria]|uniref:tRNA/rRNA methyltransferase family protein n=1 Tax=Quillaja saponaria TaxID=32244 RepID=A0AAD7QIV9_QUISA|nr:tRNA/rRNA methyltransferase family protein [Quillaja saponaria]